MNEEILHYINNELSKENSLSCLSLMGYFYSCSKFLEDIYSKKTTDVELQYQNEFEETISVKLSENPELLYNDIISKVIRATDFDKNCLYSFFRVKMLY